MTRRTLAIAFSLALGLTAAAAIRSEEQAPPAPAAPPAAKPPAQPQERQINIKAPGGTLHWEDTTGIVVITGPTVTIEFPDWEGTLTASRVEYHEREGWARATGKPRLWDPQNEITADTMRVDFRARRADMQGNVRLVARPRDGKADGSGKARDSIKEPVVVYCDTMQYFYREKRGTGTGNLKITQRDRRADRTATGKRLSYDGNEETVTLEGDVRVSNTRGEGLECDLVVFNLREGSEGLRVEGMRNATFFVREDDEGEPAATP